MQNEDKHAHGIYMFLSHGIEKNNMSNYLFLSNHAYSVWKRYITIALFLQYNTKKLSDLVGNSCLYFTFVSLI